MPRCACAAVHVLMACAAVQRLQARTFLALFGLRCVFGIILNPFNKIENQIYLGLLKRFDYATKRFTIRNIVLFF